MSGEESPFRRVIAFTESPSLLVDLGRGPKARARCYQTSPSPRPDRSDRNILLLGSNLWCSQKLVWNFAGQAAIAGDPSGALRMHVATHSIMLPSWAWRGPALAHLVTHTGRDGSSSLVVRDEEGICGTAQASAYAPGIHFRRGRWVRQGTGVCKYGAAPQRMTLILHTSRCIVGTGRCRWI